MFKHIPDVISDEEAVSLINETRNGEVFRLLRHGGNDIVERLVSIVKEHAPAKTTGKAYWRVESKGDGHDWHYDGAYENGKPNHMAWCQYSAVVLLSDPSTFNGGEFEYRNSEDEIVSLKEELHKNMIVYSSGIDNDPVLHRANPHGEGRRFVLLMFFEG
tara:strand:+ start:111 stop:590 length:480 start_codon:yes stop_codon:yes gene_type:complete